MGKYRQRDAQEHETTTAQNSVVDTSHPFWETCRHPNGTAQRKAWSVLQGKRAMIENSAQRIENILKGLQMSVAGIVRVHVKQYIGHL